MAEEKPEKEKQSFASLMKKANRLKDRGKSSRAFDLYAKAAGLEHKRPEPRSGMGWCYLDMNKTAAAIGSFKSALDVAPKFADAHMGLAESYRARDNKAKALNHYQRYLEIQPSGGESAVAKRWVEQLSSP